MITLSLVAVSFLVMLSARLLRARCHAYAMLRRPLASYPKANQASNPPPGKQQRSTNTCVIGYACDVEGNIEYWDRYVQISKVITRRVEDGRLKLVDDTCRFVYGGDVCDRGPGDIRILRDLVQLKEDNPDRVHLIMGNRDVNKLRVQFALSPGALSELPVCYWLRAPKNTDAASSLVSNDVVNAFSGNKVAAAAVAVDGRAEAGREVPSAPFPHPRVAHLMVAVPDGYKLHDRESKIKWMLGKTMGSPIAFAMRKEELKAINPTEITSTRPNQTTNTSPNTTSISDSYLALTDPEHGLLTRYLELAQISVVLGDILFVHGAVLNHNMGWVPPGPRELGSHSSAGQRDKTNVSSDPTPHATSPAAAASAGKEGPISIGDWELGGPVAWTRRINAFKDAELADYKKHCSDYCRQIDRGVTDVSPISADTTSTSTSTSTSTKAHEMLWEFSGRYDHPQPGSRLLQYGMGRWPDGTLNPSVIYASYLRDGRPISTTDHLPSCSGSRSSSGGDAGKVSNVVTTGDGTSSGSGSGSSAGPLDRVVDWLRKDGIRKVVVGHQPVGDAPLIFQTSGVQFISADTSYSKNIRWAKRELCALNIAGDDAPLPLPSAPSASARAEGGERDGDDPNQWLTFEIFKEGVDGHGEGSWAAASYSTRGKRCALEICFAMPSHPTQPTQPSAKSIAVPISPHELSLAGDGDAVAGGGAAESEVFIHGELSNELPYSFSLPVSKSDDQYDGSDYIGRMTADGWVVRARGVQLPAYQQKKGDTSTTGAIASGPGGGDGGGNRISPGGKATMTSAMKPSGGPYYLLTHVNGFTFRNRLVPEAEIHTEFQ